MKVLAYYDCVVCKSTLVLEVARREHCGQPMEKKKGSEIADPEVGDRVHIVGGDYVSRTAVIVAVDEMEFQVDTCDGGSPQVFGSRVAHEHAKYVEPRTCVFKYGLLLPRKEDNPAIWTQLRAAHRYYNKRIEIELKRRTAYREIRSESDSEVARLEGVVADLQARVEAATAVIQGQRQKTRSAKTDPAAKELVTTLKAKRKVVYDQLKAVRKAARTNLSMKKAVDHLDETSHQMNLAAREASGVYWGTYQLVERSADQARKAKDDPAFKKWAGVGRLGVQLPGGLEVPELFEKDSQVRVKPVDPEAWTSPVRGTRRRLSRTTLSLRICSTGKGKPVWAEWPMIMHRPLPTNSKIMGVHVHAHRRADRTFYTVDFVLRLPDIVPSGRSGMVGVDLGWRKMGDEIRAAYWYDDAGREGELLIPAKVQWRQEKARSLRSIRDTTRDTMLPALSEALRHIDLPPDLEERSESLYLWQSFKRLHKLYWFWKGTRFEGDLVAWQILEAWHHRDLHLHQYEAGNRAHALGHRREVYRKFAAHLAKTYGHVILEAWDMSETAERKPPEEDTADSRKPNRQRFDAGVSELRLAILNSVLRDGNKVLRTPAAYTTLMCNACQHIQKEVERIIPLEHTCENCGKRWDQDANAARNLLASGQAMLKDPELLAAANPPPKIRKPRFKKRKKAKLVEPETAITERSQPTV